MSEVRGRWTTMARAGALVCCALLAACSNGGGDDNSGPNCASSTVSITIEPAAPTVVASTKQPFVATVTGTADTAVTWIIQEGPNGGSISGTGVYTAPAAPGTYHVTAESQADSCATATVAVTVQQVPLITVTISPSGSVDVEVNGGRQTFVATVTGTTDTAVTWSVQPGGAGGQINSITGVYTAPTTFGVINDDVVIATSVVDASAFDQVVVHVIASTPVVNISPTEVTVGLGGRVEFTLSGQIAAGGWMVDGMPDGNSAVGRINSTGLYTAPFHIPTPTTVVSVAKTGAANSSTVTLVSRFLNPETRSVDGCNPPCVADQPNAILAADLNGDGLDDLATANTGTGTVSLLIAADKSNFANPVRYPVGDPNSSEPQALAVGNLNAGSMLDLAIADASPSGLAVRTRLGVGDGTFGAERVTPLPSDRTPLSIAVGYLDSDPALDVVVANLVTNMVDILQGVGDGTFVLSQSFDASSGIDGPIGIAVADFNRDNFDDIAVANSTGDTVSVLLSNAIGSFDVQTISFALGSGPSAVAAVRLDNNNYPDIVVTTAGNNQLVAFLNNGDPAVSSNPRFLGPVTTLTTGNTPVAVATGDFNNDAFSDVVVVNQAAQSISTYLFDPVIGELVQSETYPVGASPQALAVGDFNGDGWDDVAVANSLDDTVSVLRNRGGATAP